MNPIVARAESWLDTPFVHQGRLKGVGVDCLGLAIDALDLHQYDRTGYSMTPNGKLLSDEIAKVMRQVPTNALQAGDLLLFRIVNMPQHVGIYAGDELMIHAYTSIGKVVRTRLNETWKRRLVAAYRLENLCS